MTPTISETAEQGDEGHACAAWIRLSAGVMRGLTHSLGNRVHAFEMTLSSIAPGDPVTDDVISVFGHESAACAEIVRLYRLVNFADQAEPEACRFPDAVPDAVTLWGYHVESDGATWRINVHDEPPAVLAPPVALTQAVLLLFIAHAQSAQSHGAVLTLDVRGDDGWLVAEFASSPAETAPAGASGVAAAWLLRGSHATVTQTLIDGRAVSTVRLASLAMARSLERAARQ